MSAVCFQCGEEVSMGEEHACPPVGQRRADRRRWPEEVTQECPCGTICTLTGVCLTQARECPGCGRRYEAPMTREAYEREVARLNPGIFDR